ncbi:hypothetical protein NDU88_002079, partial [Pleurodeles waltl]
MSSTFSPSLACLYVDNFERQVVLHEDNPYLEQIKLWKRYTVLMTFFSSGQAPEMRLTAFQPGSTTANLFLKFTMTIVENQLPFLDLLIHESNGSLATVVYHKPTDRNNLLQFKSYHPRSLRENLPVGQFLRLRRNCSNLSDYNKHANNLSTKLQERDYPAYLVRRAYKRARNNNRDQLLQPRANKPKTEQIA